MVAVVGVSASSQANLLATIDSLGTNLLTVAPGQTFLGANEVLPSTAVASILHQPNVQTASAVYQVSNATVLRTPYVPSEQTGGIGVDAADPGCSRALGDQHGLRPVPRPEATRASRPWCSARRRRASSRSRASSGHIQVFLGGTWFTVVGIMKPALLDPNLDTTVFIGLPIAERLFQTQPNASEIYVRANVRTTSRRSRTCSRRRPTRRTPTGSR